MPIKRIYSAGGIVVRKSTKGTKSTKGVEVLVTQHSKHKGWDFPKGHREIYESEEQTALREVEEETGVEAEIIDKVGQTQYFYYEEGSRVLKTVVFYLMKCIGEGEASTAFEVSGKVWLPLDKVEGKLTFKDTKQLWLKVKPKIAQLTLR
ncbi:hypothetical protein A3F45_00830 [Candidatus Curtissbacteria bacterium RIFCSPHIGHO2_12_FULL_41_17]|uniref:Nudix hydrolase domain-containing protein n=2 Tax=Candidatus Curtissiibacteriota TaxID=1752717 RepID=A0A1F5HK43_9BACT|nr:MAG: hypothetical protein A2693_04400 [Candidatus Curtissbacteria bacterium RIFCSPHIGHO2_01_FULL_40_12]OGE04425.1 MAG: hypothetical protein A3F45_00830 [Candidatus Curtissbacteria bacterium RIFCSPHIGHO2_12_FULL_41_17]